MAYIVVLMLLRIKNVPAKLSSFDFAQLAFTEG